MRLAAKLVSVAVLAIVVVSTANGYLRVRREVALFHKDMRHDVAQLAHATTGVVVEAWGDGGYERARSYVERMDRAAPAISVRLVWVTDSDANLPHPAVPVASLANLSSDNYVSTEVRVPSGKGHLYTYAPLDVGSTTPCALEFSESLDDLDTYTRATVVRVAVFTLILVGVSAIGVLLVGVLIVGRPLGSLVDKVHRVGLGDLSRPLALRGHDELVQLASAINDMCGDLAEARAHAQRETEARIAALEQLRHADRLKSVGRLASGLAHEMGTPLNVISGRASLLAAGKLSKEDATSSALTIKAQADRITALVRQLLDFARHRTPERVAVDIGQLVTDTLELLKPQSLKYKATLSSYVEEDLITAYADIGQVQQVLVNLVVNAMQALRNPGSVTVHVAVTDVTPPAGSGAEAGSHVRIAVVDTGEGISKEDIPHVFEPFFTTKDIGQGTGLGLPITYGIVREHGGWIDVESDVGRGTRVTVFLPLKEEPCPQDS